MAQSFDQEEFDNYHPRVDPTNSQEVSNETNRLLRQAVFALKDSAANLGRSASKEVDSRAISERIVVSLTGPLGLALAGALKSSGLGEKIGSGLKNSFRSIMDMKNQKDSQFDSSEMTQPIVSKIDETSRTMAKMSSSIVKPIQDSANAQISIASDSQSQTQYLKEISENSTSLSEITQNIADAIGELKQFSKDPDAPSSKGGIMGTAKSLGMMIFRTTKAGYMFSGKYGNDIIRNENPMVTAANALLQIYRWQRLYGDLTKRQLNEVIKGVPGGKLQEVVGERGAVTDFILKNRKKVDIAIKQYAEKLDSGTVTGKLTSKLFSAAAKTLTFFNSYDLSANQETQYAAAHDVFSKILKNPKKSWKDSYTSTKSDDLSRGSQLNSQLGVYSETDPMAGSNNLSKTFKKVMKGIDVSKPVTTIQSYSKTSNQYLRQIKNLISPISQWFSKNKASTTVEKMNDGVISSTGEKVIKAQGKTYKTRSDDSVLVMKSTQLSDAILTIKDSVSGLLSGQTKESIENKKRNKQNILMNQKIENDRKKESSKNKIWDSIEKKKSTGGAIKSILGSFFSAIGLRGMMPIAMLGLSTIMFPKMTMEFLGWGVQSMQNFFKALTVWGKVTRIANSLKSTALSIVWGGSKGLWVAITKPIQAVVKLSEMATKLIGPLTKMKLPLVGNVAKSLLNAVNYMKSFVINFDVLVNAIGKAKNLKDASGVFKSVFQSVNFIPGMLTNITKLATEVKSMGRVAIGAGKTILQSIKGIKSFGQLVTGGISAIQSVFTMFKTGFSMFKGVAGRAAAGAGTKIAGKFAGKIVLKRIPIIGSIISMIFAWQSFKKKQYRRSLLEMSSGLVGLLDLMIPGVGTVASLAIDALNIFLDVKASKPKPVNPVQTVARTKGFWLNFPVIGSIIQIVEGFSLVFNGNYKQGIKGILRGLMTIVPSGGYIFDAILWVTGKLTSSVKSAARKVSLPSKKKSSSSPIMKVVSKLITGATLMMGGSPLAGVTMMLSSISSLSGGNSIIDTITNVLSLGGKDAKISNAKRNSKADTERTSRELAIAEAKYEAKRDKYASRGIENAVSDNGKRISGSMSSMSSAVANTVNKNSSISINNPPPEDPFRIIPRSFTYSSNGY